MIYLMGCSHLMALLDAACEGGWGAHVRRLQNGRAPEFSEWAVRDGALPGRLQVASLYLGHTVPHWGPVLAHMNTPDVVGIAPGFQALLQSIATGADGADSTDSVLFATLQGEEHYLMALTARQAPFDFDWPARPDLPILPGRPVIPLPAVEHEMARRLEHALATLAAIRATCRHLKVVLILCPPPARTDSVVERYALDEQPAPPIAAVDSGLRLKLYLLYVQMLSAAARRHGIGVLAAPDVALHTDGSLRPEFVKDVVHGNRAYGDLVLQQMSAVACRAAECVS